VAIWSVGAIVALQWGQEMLFLAPGGQGRSRSRGGGEMGGRDFTGFRQRRQLRARHGDGHRLAAGGTFAFLSSQLVLDFELLGTGWTCEGDHGEDLREYRGEARTGILLCLRTHLKTAAVVCGARSALS
jgi:hypothetical protein